MKRFKIEYKDRGGYWNEKAQFSDRGEAIDMAELWARKDPRADWGVRVFDADLQQVIHEL